MFNLFFALENIREKNSIECSIDKTVYIYTYALLAKHVTMQLTMDELFSQLIMHDFLLLISRSLPCIPFFISSHQYIYIINTTMFDLFFALENIRSEKNSVECSIDKTVYIYAKSFQRILSLFCTREKNLPFRFLSCYQWISPSDWM